MTWDFSIPPNVFENLIYSLPLPTPHLSNLKIIFSSALSCMTEKITLNGYNYFFCLQTSLHNPGPPPPSPPAILRRETWGGEKKQFEKASHTLQFGINFVGDTRDFVKTEHYEQSLVSMADRRCLLEGRWMRSQKKII